MFSSPLAQPHRWISGSRISTWYTGLMRATKASQENHPLPDADGDRFGAAGYVELGKDRSDVKLDGMLGNLQFPRDVLVGESLRQQAQHLDLARGKRRVRRFR